MIIQKKVIRTMMDNKSQYLGSLALIVLSCLMFTMFTQLTKNLSGLTSSFEKKYVQEDANFRTDKTNRYSAFARIAIRHEDRTGQQL